MQDLSISSEDSSHVRTFAREDNNTKHQITTHFEGTFIKLSGNVRNFEVKHYDIYNDIALRTTRDERVYNKKIDRGSIVLGRLYTKFVVYIIPFVFSAMSAYM